MREIKFRAWVYEYEDIFDVVEINFIREALMIIEDAEEYYFGFDEVELMQCTGLKDKNGVEVHEGDIIEFKPYTVSCDSKRRGIVVYDKANYCAEIKNQFKYNIIDCFDLEVIGNVFENKELLK